MLRPRPVPWPRFVENNGSKMWGSMSAEYRTPVSLMRISMLPTSVNLFAEIVMRPPSPVAWAAFNRRVHEHL